ncbi:M23 family metallopeptidase [Streptomyces sp. NPDC001774]
MAFALGALLATGSAVPASAAAPFRAAGQDSVITPVTAGLITTPAPFKAIDGRIHFSYELLVTDSIIPESKLRLDRVDVTANSGTTLYSLRGKALAASANPVSSLSPGAAGKENPSPPTPVLSASSQWIIWLDFSLRPGTQVPDSLRHTVSGSILQPPGGGDPQPFKASVADVRVSRQAPPVLGAPVGPGTWYANEACCDDTHHRRVALPVDGRHVVPQRFAIDWFLIGPDKQLWKGDPARLDSYTSYRQPVIAAAAGTVVAVKDGVADNTPMKPPANLAEQDSTGNHVIIQTGPGRYLLYAHLHRGSVKVRKGDEVQAGSPLGLIGNSGLAFVPHLHFGVLTGADIFSDSTPYVFRSFNVLGHVKPRIWDDNIGQQRTGVLPITPTPLDGPHRAEAPLDRYVIRFT